MVKNIVLVLMVLLLTAPASYAADDDPVIAEAGDFVIKQSDLDRYIGYMPPEKQKHFQDNPQQKVTLVKRILQVKVISDRARKEGLDKAGDVKERLDHIVNDFLSREYLTGVIMKNVSVTDEDMEQYYNLNKEKFSVPEQVRARHILIKVSPDAPDEEKSKAREKAQAILERAKKGEDFAQLATENSDDPGSGSRGGDLGFFGRGRMVKTFEEAAFSLKPGQMSGIVETRFGYHIIKAEEYTEARTKPLDEVKDTVQKQLKDEMAKSKATEFIQTVTEEAGMKVHADRITGVQK
jgi:peptidyl-prolyl cis-trans isomerase C